MQRFSNLFIYFCKTLYMIQTAFPSIIRSKICTYSVRYLSDRYCCLLTLYVQFCAPDDGRKSRLKHVERLTEINKFEKRCIFLVVL